MRNMVLVIAFLISLTAPASAQKAEIEAINAKWIEFFNKGDFSGIASLYSADAIALPPGSAMVHGRPAIEVMWNCLLYTSPSPRDRTRSRMPSSA